MLASGAASFTYEVLWTRLLGHVLGASVYSFATMLATFLTGIALGSWAASRMATSAERGVFGFSLAQLGTAGFSLLPQDTGLSNAGGYTRGNCCTDRLNLHDYSGLIGRAKL